MSRMFGTDGVRGIAGEELTPELAMQLGAAGACVLAGDKGHKPVILIGRDTRISGGMLGSALIAGITSTGADVIDAGVVPTPAIAYLTVKYGCDAGVVISASHNPAKFNGIKFFDGRGFKLPDATEDKIEALIKDGLKDVKRAAGDASGRVTNCDNAAVDYAEHCAEAVNVDLKGLKIVIDCAEGASSVTSPMALKKLGADLTVLHNSPDGVNINRDCGSTHMEELCKTVKELHADAGLAFDGDADRCLAVDENGNMIDGDVMMAINAMYMKEKGILKKDTLTVTVMSNLGLTLMAEKNGIKIVKTKVGDRYVLEQMKEDGTSIGGEQSGHIIFLDENTTGDGLLSGLHLLRILKESGKKMSELAKVMEVLPQALVNVPVPNDKKAVFADIPEVKSAIEDLEKKYSGEGRVLIRPSGTEPLVRVMIEGRDKGLIDADAKALADVIAKAVS